MVLHSVTKFINGHADVVGGIIVAKEMDIYKRLRKAMVNSGCNMDPHQAFLVLRGLKTLGIRIERAQQSAMEIARWLEKQPEVSAVRYIGLESHPQHELAKRQMSGFGSMISFELKGGMKAGRLLMDHVRVATLAVSLGGVETLIEHPASMTHASISPEDRRAAGYSDGLVRYSVGIEDVVDLIADLRQALDAVSAQPLGRSWGRAPQTPSWRSRLWLDRASAEPISADVCFSSLQLRLECFYVPGAGKTSASRKRSIAQWGPSSI